MNNINLILIVPEAEDFKIKVPIYSVCVEGMLPGLQTTIFSLCHLVEGTRELSAITYQRHGPPLITLH